MMRRIHNQPANIRKIKENCEGAVWYYSKFPTINHRLKLFQADIIPNSVAEQY